MRNLLLLLPVLLHVSCGSGDSTSASAPDPIVDLNKLDPHSQSEVASFGLTGPINFTTPDGQIWMASTNVISVRYYLDGRDPTTGFLFSANELHA